MKRIAVFGGTFDPPHLGHVRAAEWVTQSGQVDRVLVVPVLEHAFHKQPGIDFQERLELCRVAFSGVPDVVVSDIEASLPKPSYTMETVRELARREPDATFRLVVGTDILPDLPHWREGEALLRLAPPLVLGRKGHPGPGQEADLPEVSSSELRELLGELRRDPERAEVRARLQANLDPRVFEHILEHGYYSGPKA